MPEPNNGVLSRRTEIVSDLRRILPAECVIAEEEELRAYECDGLTAYRQLPLIVVLPETTEQVSDVLQYCYGEGIKIVPRGRARRYPAVRCRLPMGLRSAWGSLIVF